MGGVARANLVSAVIESGAYGFLGMVREAPEFIRSEIEQVRSQSNRPFGVNLIPAATEDSLLDKQISLCIDQQVASVCLFWDIYPEIVERLANAGILVLYQVGNVKDAIKAWQAGADILIAQGAEAGGHVRGNQSTLTLVPEVVDATPLPVVASGGIVDGRGMAAALALGAQAVHCGTLFLATNESNAHDYHKQRVVESCSEDTVHTRIFHINWPVSAAVRVIKNSTTLGEYDACEKIVAYENEKPIPLFSTDSPLKETRGDLECMALYAGQGVSQIKAILPASERIAAMMNEIHSLINQHEDPRPGSSLPAEQEIVLSSSPCSRNELDKNYTEFPNPDD